MPVTLANKWTSHLPTETDKEPFRQRLRTSLDIFERLATILSEKKKASLVKQTDFSTPSWAEKCAFELGYQQAMKEVADLLPKLEEN